MRTTNRNFTIRSVFGFNQDRIVVSATAGTRKAGPQRQHLGLWHALLVHSYRGLKRRVKAVVTSAAWVAESMCSAMYGPQPCRQPVRLWSPAPVIG